MPCDNLHDYTASKLGKVELDEVETVQACSTEPANCKQAMERRQFPSLQVHEDGVHQLDAVRERERMPFNVNWLWSVITKAGKTLHS